MVGNGDKMRKGRTRKDTADYEEGIPRQYGRDPKTWA